MLELIIIAVYFLAMVVVGVASRRRVKGIDDFFVAGRKGSSLFITGSLLATIIGGSATVGMAGLGFSQGLTGAWWLLVGSIGLVILGLFLAKKVRRFGLYTLPELVAKQYDERIALAASILIVVAWVGIIAAQIVASGIILGMLGIGSPLLWMVVCTAVFVIYTILGGQYAVIRTDVLQIAIVFIGLFSGLALLLQHLGGLSGLSSVLSPEQFAFPLGAQFGGVDLVKLLLLVGLTYVVGPDMYSRLFCARDGKTARTSVFWAALLIVPFAFGITLVGMGASVLFPQISPEQAFPTVIKEILPPFLGSIVLAALLCAVMSSADTCLLSASTILAVDIVGRFRPSLSQVKILSLSRWGIVVVGVSALVLALTLKGVINTLLFAYTIYTCGLILPVIAGFYKDKLKVTSAGALAAIIGGGSAALAGKLFDITYLDLGGLLISGLLLFMVSFVDNRMKSRKRLPNT
ncbi:MAG TPA: sodium:solute symporter family protein [Dehalococcoidales bacterium]|nr:sodium:solute symporter family protein [Dehalococcoidales bacterium]